MESRISIPKPCHEDWDKMLPEVQGRHCLACSKTVIDFTGWETEEIFAYLQNSNKQVCGRMNRDQVAPPSIMDREQLARSIWNARIPLLRKIAAMIVVCFGLLHADKSIAQQKMGKMASPQQEQALHITGEPAIQLDTFVKKPPVLTDTVPRPVMMGMIAPYKPPVKPLKALTTGTKKVKDTTESIKRKKASN